MPTITNVKPVGACKEHEQQVAQGGCSIHHGLHGKTRSKLCRIQHFHLGCKYDKQTQPAASCIPHDMCTPCLHLPPAQDLLPASHLVPHKSKPFLHCGNHCPDFDIKTQSILWGQFSFPTEKAWCRMCYVSLLWTAYTKCVPLHPHPQMQCNSSMKTNQKA
jgi:hypothetical protein